MAEPLLPRWLSLGGSLARIAKVTSAKSAMSDRVAEALYRALCDGKVQSKGRIEDISGKILNIDDRIDADIWEKYITFEKFVKGLWGHNQTRFDLFPEARSEDSAFLANVSIEAASLDHWLGGLPLLNAGNVPPPPYEKEEPSGTTPPSSDLVAGEADHSTEVPPEPVPAPQCAMQRDEATQPRVGSSSADLPFPSPQSAGRRRGPKPRVMERVIANMERDLRDGQTTTDTLDKDKEETLAKTYDASRDTVRKARKKVLKDCHFVGIRNSDK